MDIEISSEPTVIDIRHTLDLARAIDLERHRRDLERKFRFSFERATPTQHLFARSEGGIVGYAHLARTGSADGISAELAVSPTYQRRGIGRKLLGELRRLAAGQGFRLWCHGVNSSALRFASRTDLMIGRQMALLEYPKAALKDLRAAIKFELLSDSHSDVDSFVTLVNDAYSPKDLGNSIVHQSWFRSDHVVVSRGSGGALLGAMVIRPITLDGHPAGELHALAIDPATQGSGLGRQLIKDSLSFCATHNMEQVMSYTDLENPAAIRAHLRSGLVWGAVDAEFIGTESQSFDR